MLPARPVLLFRFGLPCAEYLGVELEASLLQPLHELRAEAARLQRAVTHVARTSAAMIGGLVHENILKCDLIAFHALQLGDLDNLATAVLEAALLNDQLYRAGDLAADDLKRKVHAGHQRQRLKATYAVAG